MRIAIPHFTTPERARHVIEERIKLLLTQYGHYADQLQHDWAENRLTFALKARGMSTSGTLEVTDKEVILDGKLPLMAMPFESRIRSTVQREAEAMFRTA